MQMTDGDSVLIAPTSRVEGCHSQCAVTTGWSTISEDVKLRPPELINFTSPYLHHQECKWHDLDNVLIASMSRLQTHSYCHDIPLTWAVISEPWKFRTLPLPKFTFSYLHHQQCKWHNLGSVLIAPMSRVEGCHLQWAITAAWSTISKDRKLRTLPSPNFTSPYLHHQECKWHNLDSVLIISTSRVERCHPSVLWLLADLQ